ncbi:MAG: hypothetical protein LBG89_00415 [Rickettsiales bacterium]|jgi:hypothetical protein|nr:hypothetical protein [Rickettsiales bacterium]
MTRTERGASLLDVILTIGIIGVSAPFLYGKITDGAAEIRRVGYANHLTRLGGSVANYIALNESLWPDEYQVQIPADKFFEVMAPFGAAESRNLPPPSVMVFKSTSAAGIRTTNAYMITDMEGSTILSLHRFARLLGPEGGISEDGGFAYSGTGQWSARIPDLPPNKIVLRITEHASDTERARFMHRARALDAPELNTMEVDLGLSDAGRRSSVINVKKIEGVGLEAEDAIASNLTAASFAAETALFQQGLRMAPAESSVNVLRVGGDILGARRIAARAIFGGVSGGSMSAASEAVQSNQGRIVADRTIITESVEVGNNLSIKPGIARSVSAFAEITAYSLSAPQMTAGHISAAGGSGITISSDKMGDASNPPLKLGSWTFPNSSGSAPEFRNLRIMSWSSDSVADILGRVKNPMAKINSKGWVEAEVAR